MHVLVAALHRPTKPTGVCRHAVNLAHALVDQPKVSKVSIVVGSWQSAYFVADLNLDTQRVQLIAIDLKHSAISRNLWFLLGLPKLANSVGADMVHLSFPLPFVRSLFPCPVVATIHDLYPYEKPENFGYPGVVFNQLFLSQCIRNSSGLTCVSKTTLDSLDNYFPSASQVKPTTHIYNCVDFSSVEPQVPQQLASLPAPFLLAVAQHRKNKNLDLLIKAYASLRQTGHLAETNLILVGSSGPETENMLEIIKVSGLNEKVLLLSSIQDTELVWLYKNCKLLVIPSSTEGFCLPLAEGTACGCQVVCSDIPIFRELGFSHCIYFSLQGEISKNLEMAICTALENGQSAEAPTPAENRFSKAHTGKQYIAFYSELTKCQR